MSQRAQKQLSLIHCFPCHTLIQSDKETVTAGLFLCLVDICQSSGEKPRLRAREFVCVYSGLVNLSVWEVVVWQESCCAGINQEREEVLEQLPCVLSYVWEIDLGLTHREFTEHHSTYNGLEIFFCRLPNR